MNLTLEKLDEIIAYLNEADKGISSTYSAGVPARDAIMYSQSTVWFKMGMKDEKAMAAGMALYNKTMSGLKTNMFDVYSKVSSGQLNYTQALRDWRRFTGQFYQDFFKSGAMSMGNPFYAEMGPTRRDLGVLAGARRYEEKFFKRYLNDIIKQRSGNFTPADEARWARHPLDVRSQYYAESGKAQFFNGMVAGAGDDVEIWWRLGVAEHCDLCPIYSMRSYTWNTLPAIPRAGMTPCLYNCKCWLDIKPKSKTQGTPDPRMPMIPKPTVTPGEGVATRFPSGIGQVAGSLLHGIDDMFYQMNKIRQMIGLETDAAMKADFILQRKVLNQEIIDLLAKKKVRAVPKISVADLTAAAKDAQLRAGALVDDWAALKINQEIYVLTGTTLRKGLVQFDLNGKPILQSSEGLFLLDAKYDIIMKAAKKGKPIVPVAPEPGAVAPETVTALKTKNPKFLAFGTEENLAAYLKAEYAKGRSMGDLAKEFDVSNARISELFKKYNVKGAPTPPPVPPIPIPIPPKPMPPPEPPPPQPLPIPPKNTPIKSKNPKLLAFGTEENLAAFLKSQYANGRTIKSLAFELGVSPSRVNELYKKYGVITGVPGEPRKGKGGVVEPPLPPGSMKQTGMLKPPQFKTYAEAERYLIDNDLIYTDLHGLFAGKIQHTGKVGRRPVQKVIKFDVREMQVVADSCAQLKNSLGTNYKVFDLYKVKNYDNAHYHDAWVPKIVIGDKIEAHWQTPRMKNQLANLKSDYAYNKGQWQHVTNFGRGPGTGQMTAQYYRDKMTDLAKKYRDMARTIRSIETGKFDLYQLHSNYATGGARTLEGTVFHEYGHLFEYKNEIACRKFMREEMGWNFQAAPREFGNQSLTTYQISNLSLDSRYMLEITQRSMCNYKEMWAENFTLFSLGKWERMHSKVVKFFRQYMPDIEPIDLKPDLKKTFMYSTKPATTSPWMPGGGKTGIAAQAKSMNIAAMGIDPSSPYFSVADDLIKHNSYKAYIKGLKPEIESTLASREAIAKYVKQAQSGNLDPIIVDKNNLNRIIDGNHRLAAAQKLGIEPKIYAVDRIDFIRGAAKEGEINYLKKLIAQGRAVDINSGIVATTSVRAKSIGQIEPATQAIGDATSIEISKGVKRPGDAERNVRRALDQLPDDIKKLADRIVVTSDADRIQFVKKGPKGDIYAGATTKGTTIYVSEKLAGDIPTLTHELAHIILDNPNIVVKGTTSIQMQQIWKDFYQDAQWKILKFPSIYARSGFDELFSESFAHWMTGKKLDPELSKWLDDFFKGGKIKPLARPAILPKKIAGKPEPVARSVEPQTPYRDPDVKISLKSEWAVKMETFYKNRILKKLQTLPEGDVRLIRRIVIVDNQTAAGIFGRAQKNCEGLYWQGGTMGGQVGYNIYFPLSTKTIAHEVGHAVYFQAMSIAERQAVREVFLAARKFVTNYAKTNAMEFFAENYSFYHEGRAAQGLMDKGIKAILDKRYGKDVDIPMPVPKPVAGKTGATPIRTTNPNIQAFGTEEAFSSWLKVELGKGRTMTSIAGELACSNARVSELAKKYGIGKSSVSQAVEPEKLSIELALKRDITKKEFAQLEDRVVKSDDYNLFQTYSSKWTSGIRADARNIAYDLAQRNVELQTYLLHGEFGSKLPQRVKLYRVGSTPEEEISSFFTMFSAAKRYAKRMGVETAKAYTVDIRHVVPSGAASGEVWARGARKTESELSIQQIVTRIKEAV